MTSEAHVPGRNPWRTTSSRQIYENPWIEVREDQVVRADGSHGIYGVVRPRNLALGAVPLFADGTIVLVGQHRYPLDEWSWEIPEGGGDPASPPEEEMARELREETGLTAGRWRPLGGRLALSNSITNEQGLVFLAEDLTQGDAEPEPTEELARWRLPLTEAVVMAMDGRISDALSVIALLRAAVVVTERGP